MVRSEIERFERANQIVSPHIILLKKCINIIQKYPVWHTVALMLNVLVLLEFLGSQFDVALSAPELRAIDTARISAES